jgi:hypothetical protein
VHSNGNGEAKECAFSEQFQCQLCGATFNSGAQSSEHYTGKKHSVALGQAILSLLQDHGGEMTEASLKPAFEQRYGRRALHIPAGSKLGTVLGAVPGLQRYQPPGKTHWLLRAQIFGSDDVDPSSCQAKTQPLPPQHKQPKQQWRQDLPSEYCSSESDGIENDGDGRERSSSSGSNSGSTGAAQDTSTGTGRTGGGPAADVGIAGFLFVCSPATEGECSRGRDCH